MSSKTPVIFGTTEYGSGLYGNNQDCTFIATNPPEGHRITAEIYYESESCCDFLKFTGLTDPDVSIVIGYTKSVYDFEFKGSLKIFLKVSNFGISILKVSISRPFNYKVEQYHCVIEFDLFSCFDASAVP